MSIKEISEVLYQGVPELVENIFYCHQETSLLDSSEIETCEDLKEDLLLDSCLMALKVKRSWNGTVKVV